MKTDKKGFTLVECLISIILLAIILAGGMKFYFDATNIMTMGMQKKMALEIANLALDQMKATGYASLPNPATGSCEASTTINFSFLTQNFSVEQRRRVTDVEGTSPNINKKVEIEVCWPTCPLANCMTQDVTGIKKVILATYMSP